MLWAIALVAVIAADGPPLAGARSRRARAGSAPPSPRSIATVFTMAYLGWNPVGERVIRGVQGRYWAPAVPMLVVRAAGVADRRCRSAARRRCFGVAAHRAWSRRVGAVLRASYYRVNN